MFVSCVGRTLLRNEVTILRSQRLTSPLMMLSSRPYLTNVKKESVSEKMTDLNNANEMLNTKDSIKNMEVLEGKTRVPQGPICSICHAKIQSDQQLDQNPNQAQDGITIRIGPKTIAFLKDLCGNLLPIAAGVSCGVLAGQVYLLLR